MKFKNKLKQQVLEVLKYQDFPKVYGFYQHRKYYLAIWQKKIKENEEWIVVSLDKKDKLDYDNLLENKDLKSFVKNKSGFLVHFSSITNKQTLEKEVSKINLGKISKI